MKYVKCIFCSWVHFEVSKKRAEDEVQEFNKFFEALTPHEKREFSAHKKSDIENYRHCGRCGAWYRMFADANETDFPSGAIIYPIIRRIE